MTPSIAEQLHAAGLGVFPCSADKSPAVPRGVSWQAVAKQPPNASRWPSLLVGVPVPDGVVIFDLDKYKGVTREKVEVMLGCELPWDAALIQRTRNGGEHYAFRVDWPVIQGSNVTTEGFDTRVAGKGYICTGNGYDPVGFGLFALSQPAGLPVLPDACRVVLERRAPTVPARAPLPVGDRDVETIKDALQHLDPGVGRSEWLRIGLALRHQFHDDPDTGLALFDAWSSGALAEQDPPENYDPESIAPQWGSFKPHGGVTIASLFYAAISAGWKPPAGIDTAAAFGGNAATAETFDKLIDEITAGGGNPKNTNALISAVQAIQCNELQRGVLLATLHRELKEAGLLTKQVKTLLDGKKPPRPQGEYGKNHTENAAIFLETNYPDGTICRSQQVWYTYNGKAWDAVEDDDMKHEVAVAMAPSMPQHSTVSGTYHMIEALCGGKRRKINDVPNNLAFMQNGVLELDTGRMRAHSKEYFTTNLRPYSYNIQARCDAWLAFVNEIFEGDSERVDLLQEWFGYMLLPAYMFQKVMLLLGPRRCGKGTIGQVLKLLVGEQNFSGGTLKSFSDDAFIESLRTKSVVFIGDAAKNVPRSVVDDVAERIKGISGGDDQTFKRKYKSTLSEQIPARITIASNHVPRLFDDSGALASRLLVLPFNISWYDREDPALFNRLALDIEGIAIWALQGLARLMQAGRFTVPEASKAETDFISESYSPLRLFLDAACIIGGDYVATCEDVYAVYRQWAILADEENVLTRRAFVASFKDMVRGTGATYGTHRSGNVTARGFKGLTLRQLVPTGGSIPLTAVK